MNPRLFTEDQFPLEFRPLVPPALKTAYKAVDDLLADNPILGMAVKRGERGRLVDFAFNRLVESGALPFDKSWEYFERPTGRYLALRPSHSVITISQIVDPTKQPRNVLFRKNKRLSNQPFLELDGFSNNEEIGGEPHILLTHGHKELNFSHLCVPDPDHKKGYRFRSENLLHLPHEVKAEGPPPEDTDIDLDELATLKEEIERHRRDNDSG
jgi:hypothetical protein